MVGWLVGWLVGWINLLPSLKPHFSPTFLSPPPSPPSLVPWQALLESFLSQLFAASLYDADYQLVHADGDSAAIVAPEARKKAEFLSWIQSLPDTQTPAWLGLPSNAELVLLSNQGNQMVVKVLNMQSMADDDDDSASQESSALSTDTRPAWVCFMSWRCGGVAKFFFFFFFFFFACNKQTRHRALFSRLSFPLKSLALIL